MRKHSQKKKQKKKKRKKTKEPNNNVMWNKSKQRNEKLPDANVEQTASAEYQNKQWNEKLREHKHEHSNKEGNRLTTNGKLKQMFLILDGNEKGEERSGKRTKVKTLIGGREGGSTENRK